MKRMFVVLLLIISFVNLKSKTNNDTIRVYQLGDISVSGKAPYTLFSKSNIESVRFETLKNTDVNSFSELQTYIPAARIKSNSRGESLIYLRGAGERQIGLFFDGVPLNIAWDNRFDLSLLPVAIIGKIDINKTGNSILYGPNILGGAVSINTYEREKDGFGGNVRLQTGEAGMFKGAISHNGKIGKFNYLTSISYLKTDGYLLSGQSPEELLNQDKRSTIRTNTKRKFLSLYGRVEYKFDDDNKLGISLLKIKGEKGVAPETNTDFKHTRYWLYPNWDRTLLACTGQLALSDDARFILKTTAWFDLFKQEINSYTNLSYTNVNKIQNDDDRTAGTRINLLYDINKHNTLSYVVNLSYTQHREIKVKNVTSTNDVDISTSDYSQTIVSSGLDYKFSLNKLLLRSGLIFDYFFTGNAGRHIEAVGNSLTDYGFYIEPIYSISKKLNAFMNITRRTRFPTLRESYSGALGKFKINPDLQPETGLLKEIGFNYKTKRYSVGIAGFANDYSDMISKIHLTQDEDTLRRYMRINNSEITIWGFDASFEFLPFNNLSLKANLTYMSIANALKNANGKTIPVTHKPEILSGIVLSYRFDFGLKINCEIETVGRQYERNPDNKNEYLEISGTSIFNTRIAYNLTKINNIESEIFIRVNNIADTYRIYQLGLPEPGRMLRAGVILNL